MLEPPKETEVKVESIEETVANSTSTPEVPEPKVTEAATTVPASQLIQVTFLEILSIPEALFSRFIQATSMQIIKYLKLEELSIYFLLLGEDI